MTAANRTRTLAFTVLSFVLVVGVSLLAAEWIVRLKNASMKNYDMEMRRYARELKTPSRDPRLGHEHRRNAEAVLQSVTIRTNTWGLRGGEIPEAPPPGTRR